MALKDVDIIDGRLFASSHTSWATSELIYQEEGETNFESMRDSQVIWYLQNIASADSTADICRTNTPVVNGDRIFIRKDDGTIIDTVVGAVTETSTTCVPTMSAYNLPGGELSYTGSAYSGYGTSTLHRIFDGNLGTVMRWHYPNGSIIYNFENNENKRVTRCRFIKSTGYVGTVTLFGSIDGENWVTLSTHAYGRDPANNTWHAFNVESPDDYSWYKFQFYDSYTSRSDRGPQFEQIQYYTDEDLGFEFETTASTGGEIPDQVFRFEDKLYYNGVEADVADIFYEYGTTGEKLYIAAQYFDVPLDGRQIETKVEFGNAGSEAYEIAGKIYKEVE